MPMVGAIPRGTYYLVDRPIGWRSVVKLAGFARRAGLFGLLRARHATGTVDPRATLPGTDSQSLLHSAQQAHTRHTSGCVHERRA
ncbi:hypothetical protein [Paraburkholderia atlantica]|uniref:hypothetical protein n=1 Tax=Paraburkholderia atlantica TaxID=2654982 RepID=UPI003D20FE8D